jgi:hypothetical protein
MFGLLSLARILHPDTTLTKIEFIVQNVFTHYHRATTIISFGALIVLVLLRSSKNMFKKYWWIYRLPEVLLVVVVSTSASCLYPSRLAIRSHGLAYSSYSSFRRI